MHIDGVNAAFEWVVITHRQQGVLAHLARGATYREIASALFISTATVRSHVNELQRKFRARNNVSLVLAAATVGVLSVGEWPIEPTGVLEFDAEVLITGFRRAAPSPIEHESLPSGQDDLAVVIAP